MPTVEGMSTWSRQIGRRVDTWRGLGDATREGLDASRDRLLKELLGVVLLMVVLALVLTAFNQHLR